MPTVMMILNVVLITAVVVGIVGLCAWGIVSDRPFATYLTNRAMARRRAHDRGRTPREASGYRGQGRAFDLGA